MGEWVILTPAVVEFGEILQHQKKRQHIETYEKRVKIQNVRPSAIKLNFKHSYKNFKETFLVIFNFISSRKLISALDKDYRFG